MALPIKHKSRVGFTLFEVMISTMVLVFAILATVSLLPIGLRAQQLARSQMFAAAAATTLINEFHNPVVTFKGISALEPNYNGVPGTDTTDPSKPPFKGWASQLRNASIHGSPYQYNAEQVLTGWFSGVLPVPMAIARRLDSDNNEIAQLLDQGALLYYPDPNFMQGFNQGAAQDATIQCAPAPEMQKLVFAFTGYPQQNALSSHPVESLPWYENYPFPPAWISMQATGGESRRIGIIPYDPSTGGTAAPGHRSGVLAQGRDTADWSISSGIMEFSDAGHGLYYPVTFSAPFHQGQDSNTWYQDRPLDDPNSSDEYLSQDTGQVGFYQGNGAYQGRNWRYFAKNMQGLWYVGNGQASTDPLYATTDSFTSIALKNEWAWICFQRLSGGDDRFLGYPVRSYANADPMDMTPIAATSVTTITQDSSVGSTVTTAVTPSLSFPAHPPAVWHHAGWLPIRAMLTNPLQTGYEGMMESPTNPIPDPRLWTPSGGPTSQWAPPGWTNSGNVWGIWLQPDSAGAQARAWNLLTVSGIPQSSQPLATYEMRANYRDRALDLWQAVMPLNSGLAILNKNPDPNAMVNEAQGGTMVDCPKYEYPPNELDRFVMLSPHNIGPGDMPIHPAQVLALSYLAHAAMMVTGYGPPFGRPIAQDSKNFADTIRMSWEGLNWTYAPTTYENNANGTPVTMPMGGQLLPYALVPPPVGVTGYVPPQGIYKDTLFIAQDGTPAQTACTDATLATTNPQLPANIASNCSVITITNENMHSWVIYPGDEITIESSYYQWFYRYGVPWRGNGQIWDSPQDDPHKDNLGDYYNGGWYPPSDLPYPNLNYKLQTYRVLKVVPSTSLQAYYTVPVSVPGTAGVATQIPPAVVPTTPAGLTPEGFEPGQYVTITITPALPVRPTNINDATIDPTQNGGQGWDSLVVHAGEKVRRICNQSDLAFARKVYEMSLEWAAAYAEENPDDAGAPRMSGHQIMMDKPLAMFDLFYDAANVSTPGRAVRTVVNPQTADGSSSGLAALQNESFYRWMVPSNNVPQTWFYNGAPVSPVGQHDNSNVGPGWWRNSYFDQMVHNYQLKPPSPGNDDQHFWLTKPFAAFHRARSLKFWSVDWKSYADAETAPSTPVDFAKFNRMPYYDPLAANFTGVTPNGAFGLASASTGDGHSVLCGPPESLYMWTDQSRTMRYGDVVGGDKAGYLYQNWTGDSSGNVWSSPASANVEPPTTNGQPVTIDVHLGHWGADRNGNGKLDIGPVSASTRMRALSVGEYIFYDPVIRLNAGN